jgi:chromate transporter
MVGENRGRPCHERRYPGDLLGAAIPLTGALQEGWQYAVLVAAAVALLLLRRGVLQTLLAAGAVGLFASVAGAPLPH